MGIAADRQQKGNSSKRKGNGTQRCLFIGKEISSPRRSQKSRSHFPTKARHVATKPFMVRKNQGVSWKTAPTLPPGDGASPRNMRQSGKWRMKQTKKIYQVQGPTSSGVAYHNKASPG